MLVKIINRDGVVDEFTHWQVVPRAGEVVRSKHGIFVVTGAAYGCETIEEREAGLQVIHIQVRSV